MEGWRLHGCLRETAGAVLSDAQADDHSARAARKLAVPGMLLLADVQRWQHVRQWGRIGRVTFAATSYVSGTLESFSLTGVGFCRGSGR